MQFSRFVFLLYHRKALTWHDPHLIWIPETPKPGLYSFFVFYVLFSSVELLLSGGALPALLACWGDKKPAVLGLMSPACWFIPPWDPSSQCLSPSLFYSFSPSLVRSVAQGGVDKVIIIIFIAQTVSLKHTYTLSLATLTSWQPRTVEEEGFVMEGGLLGML